jgi:hypothetical protein
MTVVALRCAAYQGVVMKGGVALMGLAAMCTACAGAGGHRSPFFTQPKAPAPTLVTAAVDCLASRAVAAGGRIVRRAARFGEHTVLRLNERLEYKALRVLSLPRSLCGELTSDHAAYQEDWSSPSAPPQLKEMLALSGGRSLFVPVVGSELSCTGDSGQWRWGEPVYEDERGEVDCREAELVLAAYLFGADGTLLWKTFQRHPISSPPDEMALVHDLVESAPIDWQAELVPPPPEPGDDAPAPIAPRGADSAP